MNSNSINSNSQLSNFSTLDQSHIEVTCAGDQEPIQVRSILIDVANSVYYKELNPLGEGAEANVYDSTHPILKGKVVKIFKSITDEKIAKIEALIKVAKENPKIANYAVLPQGFVYASINLEYKPIGYVMNKLDNATPLQTVLHALAALKNNNFKKALRFIKSLDMLVHTIHSRKNSNGENCNLVIGDFNIPNFWVTKDDNLMLIDTDGFGKGEYNVSMRGAVKDVDKVEGKVLQTNDYYHSYLLLIKIILPKGVQFITECHEQYFDDEIIKKQITIFHPGSIVDARTKGFIDDLPSSVREDFVDVLVHDKRHPIKNSTINTLAQYFGYNPDDISAFAPKVEASKKPSKSSNLAAKPKATGVVTKVITVPAPIAKVVLNKTVTTKPKPVTKEPQNHKPTTVVKVKPGSSVPRVQFPKTALKAPPLPKQKTVLTNADYAAQRARLTALNKQKEKDAIFAMF
jgi:hypothetical protein